MFLTQQAEMKRKIM
jgi:hypothetical protein